MGEAFFLLQRRQMADYPHTQSPGNIKKLFAQIQSVGKPDRVGQKWLEMIGLKSKNDRRLVNLLKFLGFIDDAFKPKDEVWLEYKHTGKSKAVLATQIRASYSDLFGVYPDAPRKDDEALRNFFSTKTGLAANMVGFMVNTFKNLCELADFEADPVEPEVQIGKQTKLAKDPIKTVSVMDGGGITINVNIQLQIAATEDAAVYDKFFESLYKNVIAKNR